MAKDPVGGVKGDPTTAKQTATYQGQPYYFGAPGCKRVFEAEPQKYRDPDHKPSM